MNQHVTEKSSWGLAALFLKANKHSRLAERNVGFILDARNWRVGWWTSVQGHAHHQQAGCESFYRLGWGGVGGNGAEGLHAETAQSALSVTFKLVISGLTSVILF